MKRVLVTGGGGFIGRHLVGLLGEAGWSVRVMLAPGEPEHLLEGLDVAETVVADVRDLPSVDEAVAGCDAVVHMAAIYAHRGVGRRVAARGGRRDGRARRG